jgi:hypothetical protein
MLHVAHASRCPKTISACTQIVRADKIALRQSLSQSLQARHSVLKSTRSLKQKLSLINYGSVSQQAPYQTHDSPLQLLSMILANQVSPGPALSFLIVCPVF